MFATGIFFVLGVLAVIAALSVIYFRNPVYSAIALVGVFFALAGLFILLEAYFVAAVQVIVYAGAIMVLFLFVIMLLNLSDEASLAERLGWAKKLAIGIAALFLAEIGTIVVQVVHTMQKEHATSGTIGEPRSVAELLFTKYLLPFEVTSLILLAALIGVIALVLHRRKAQD